MKKILVTGGSGLLGQYLNLAASENLQIHSIFNNHIGNCADFPSSEIDIRNNDELRLIFNDLKPEVVIHAAAITNPQLKENQATKDYFETNVTATKSIAELCALYKVKLIYISTDLVYAGYRGSFLMENGKLIPATLYAETKLMGEAKVRETTENQLILRTALLFGIGLNHSRCHFHDMFNDLRNKKPVKLFTDQFRTPISLNDAARIIVGLANTDLIGETINLGGLERISRWELGEILCTAAGLDKNLIQKISMTDIPNFPEVEDVSLNTDKLQALGFKPRTIEENVREIIKESIRR